MATVTKLERIFLYTENGIEVRLDDPDRAYSAEQVKTFYANTYPLLAVAGIEGPTIEEDEEQYRFSAKLGIKG